MVEILPFRGLIYNKEKIEVLDKVMSPPYDIISKEMQEELYERHKYNIVRLILGRQYPEDTKENNRYTRAKEYLEEWQRKSVLVELKKEAIYPYKIEYEINKERKTMSGFFALIRLDPEYKFVKAHEKTLTKPKVDRLNLLRACEANLEPIQLLYIDEQDKVRKIIDSAIKDPIISVKGYDGFFHKLWKLEDERIISTIKELLSKKILFIADGHHRYQTAVDFCKERGNSSYRMVVLVNMFDKGLTILPTHRLIRIPNFKVEEFIREAKEYFTIEEREIKGDYESIGKSVRKEIRTNKEHKFALYFKGRFYILTLKNEGIMDRFARNRSKTWRTLDVSILHKILLEKVMGIREENIENHVHYTRDDVEAVKFVDKGLYHLSFLMNPTKIEELRAVAEAGEHMPQKSTYFLPKMLSGLVMYRIRGQNIYMKSRS